MLLETDAAYSNEKLIAVFMNHMPKGTLHYLLWKACHNHKNNHVEVFVASLVGSLLMGMIYAFCAFLQSSGRHWRLSCAVDGFTEDVIQHRCLPGAPTSRSRRLRDAI
eukprot:5284219-Pyramimonas_sp.AAC.1